MHNNYEDINDSLQRDIVNAIRARGLKEAMQKWEAEKKDTAKKLARMRVRLQRVIRITTFTSIAAAAVALMVLVVYPHRYAIYKWGYRQYAHYILHRPTTPKKLPSPQFYATAKTIIEQTGLYYSETEPLGANHQMTEATAEMSNGRYKIALDILEDIKTSDNQRLEEDTDLLRAICYAAIGKTKKARTLLQQLIDNNTPHKDTAEQLLKEL